MERVKEEFLHKGFSFASLCTIAAGAKATTGALYNYYKNKEDLFDGLRDLQELVAHDIPKEQAETYMAQLQRFRFAGWREIIGRLSPIIF